MGYYVYQYLHPIHGHLYVGRTEDLDKRIYEHNNITSDNIPRRYKSLLEESIVMYVELNNKSQGIAVEAYCIDKFKPFLNKALKYNDYDSECTIEMKLPKWQIYSQKTLVYKQQLSEITLEQKRLTREISKAENDIETQKAKLSKMNFELKEMKYETIVRNSVNTNNCLLEFDSEDIKWFYEHYKKNGKEVFFTAETYDMMGNFFGKRYYAL